jgi:hypothetical protein
MSDGKIKGTIVIEVVKFLRKYKEQARSIVPAHLQHYLSSRVLATSWHSEQDYLDLMRVVVKLRTTMLGVKPGLSAFEDAARDSSVAYFEGPYKALVRKGDPVRTLASLPALWRLRHDTGEFEVESGEGRARLQLHDYALVAREGCELVQGTLWGLMHHSGAKDIELAHTQCRARGNSTCEWQVAWT